MNPWVNVILLIPALLILGIIVLVRIKGKLENKVFLYRHEGIVLQTSLTIFKLRNEHEPWHISFGLVLLTGRRLIVFDWKQKTVFECAFHSRENNHCDLRPTLKNKTVIVRCQCEPVPRELTLRVRNPDAWGLEYSRLRAHASTE